MSKTSATYLHVYHRHLACVLPVVSKTASDVSTKHDNQWQCTNEMFMKGGGRLKNHELFLQI